MAEYSRDAGGVRHPTRRWAAFAAAATVVGVSLSIAAPEAVAWWVPITPAHLASGTPTKSGAKGSPPAKSSAPAKSPPGQHSLATATIDASVAGLDNKQPQLHFAIKTSGDLPITAVTIALPSGLAFSSNAAKLAHGVRATGTAKAQSKVRKGNLTVSLKGNSPSVNLTIGGSALTESNGLEQTVEKLITYNQAHLSDERNLALKLTVAVVSGTVVTINVPVTIDFQ